MYDDGLNRLSWYERNYLWNKQPLRQPAMPPTINQIDASISPNSGNYGGIHRHSLGDMGVPHCEECHGLGYVLEPYAGWEPSLWDKIVGTDYGIDPAFRSANGALQRYTKVLMDMVNSSVPANRWNKGLADHLISEATAVYRENPSQTSEEFWIKVRDNFKGWIKSAGWAQKGIPKIQTILKVMSGYTEGAIQYQDIQYMYSPANVLRQIVGADPEPRQEDKKFPIELVALGVGIAGLALVFGITGRGKK